jgi:hypothetical protein
VSDKYTWTAVTDESEWQALVEASPQGTLFAERLYLDAVGCPYERYVIKKGHAARAGLCVVTSEDGRSAVLDDLVIYGGLMFASEHKRPRVKRRHDEFRLSEFALQQLDERFARISLQLSPAIADMRPFLWHNYGQVAPGSTYAVDVRYTSYLDIRELGDTAADPDSSRCLAEMETVRRYSIREATRKGAIVRRGGDPRRLVEYYETLMARQGDAPSPEKLSQMERVVRVLTAAGRAEVYETVHPEGHVVYVTVYAWDAHRGYYLFGAGHPDFDEPWQGTVGHWAAFLDIAQRVGRPEIDLEGVNSPKRGWFKLGFGGELIPYYHVSKGLPV